MTWSVLESFDCIRHELPGPLESSAVERCRHIARRIPDAATSHYLEFRLNSGSQLDFLTFSNQKRFATQMVQQLGSVASPSWIENLAILQEWAADETALSSAPFVCLEYDGGDSFTASEPEASLVIGLERNYHARHWEGLRGVEQEAVDLGRAAYRRLLPQRARNSCMPVLERCFAALPALGAIPHAPVMGARDPIVAKPYVILPRESVLSFLEEIGWPGSFAALESLLDTYYAPFRRSVCLDLTITSRVEERLGLASSQFQRAETDFSNLDWWRLPPNLSSWKAALAHWPGFKETRLAGHRVWMHRWLDTKAVLRGNELEYKAYLGFSASIPPLFC